MKKPIDIEEVFLAIDLGTTTLAANLTDSNGQVLVRGTAPNPQRSEGLDVISRLEAAYKGKGKRLQNLLAAGIKDLVAELLLSAGMPKKAIKTAAAAGNSAITSLLCGSDVRPLLFPPHRLPRRNGTLLNSSALGLGIETPLFLFPLVNSFVGGDLVAFLYYQRPEVHPALYLDIGTNGELALFAEKKWLVTSVAAGPAFEAASIFWGMTAQNGAIEGAFLSGDKLHLQIKGDGRPRGICGSGVAEVIAVGLQAGLIDRNGTIRRQDEIDTNLARHIGEGQDGRFISLYRDAEMEITLSQRDIRSFQLAKGAVRAGVECLLEKAGIKPEDIRTAYLTGAFGLSIRSEVLKTVAMLPPIMLDNVVFVADGVLRGVNRFLSTPGGGKELETLAESLIPFPLSGTPAFEKSFVRALDF